MKSFNEWMQERTPEERSQRSARAQDLWNRVRPRAHARRIEAAGRYSAADWEKLENLDWPKRLGEWTAAHFLKAMIYAHRRRDAEDMKELYDTLLYLWPDSKEAAEAEAWPVAGEGEQAAYDHGRDYDAHGDYD